MRSTKKQEILNIRHICLLLCLFALRISHAQCLMFNEIMINPSGNNDGFNPPNTSEWIEIYNTCDEPVDIGCFVLTDGDFALTFPQGTTIQANSYFLIGSGNSGAPVDFNWATCNCTTATNDQVGIFTNSGEQVILVDEIGGLVNGIYWGNGQFPVNETSLALPGCPSQDITFNAAGMFFESLPYSGTEDCSYSRLCDGTWSETCGNSATPGEVNGTELVTVDFSFSDGEICVGECISFEDLSQGATGWEWTFYGASVSTSMDENPTNICYDASGTFGVQLEINSNCGPATIFYQNIIEVLPSAIPVITPSGTVNICEGDEVTLAIIGTGAIQWLQDDVNIPGANTNEWVPTEGGSYTVMITNGDCEAVSDPVQVNIATGASVSIEPSIDTNVCEGESVLFSTSGIYDTYQWLLNGMAIPGATSLNYTASASGDYSLLITSGTCTSTSGASTLSVITQPEPIIAQGEQVEFCSDEVISISTAASFDSYQWYFNGVPISSANSNTLLPTSSGNYYVEVTNDGCSGISPAINVIIHDVVSPLIEPIQDISTCAPSALLSAISAGSIQWFYNGAAIVGEIQPTLIANQDGAYYFSAYNHPTCPRNSDIVDVSLNVPLELELTASADTACEGELAQIIGIGNYTNIIWNTGQTSDTINVGSTGLFIATATDAFCVAVDSIEVFFAEFPEATAPDDFDSPCTEFLELSGTATGEASWYVDDFVVANGAVASVLAPLRQTTYVLTSEIGSCIARDSVVVNVDCVFTYAPNAFTPDGDGLNDIFRVIVGDVAFYYLRIFDRWGTVVFETDDPEAVWTGGVDEYFVPDGIYVWQIEALDSQKREVLDKSEQRGTVLVIR
jgi:gliding motility-associated-like protein